MKRRTFLLALGGGLAAAWWLKPGDQGGPHGAYFQPYNTLFRDSGPGRPLLFIDRQRLAANCRRLQQALPPGRAYRIVAKSLPSVPLIREVMAQTGTDRVMVFHQPFINAMAEAEPGCDLLLGKPMPVRAAARFYEELPEDAGFDPDRQLQWLIDSDARLKEYLELARRLDRRLRINVEIDVGLHRGGLTEPGQLDALLERIAAHPRHLAFAGFMGYDAHVGKLPDLDAVYMTRIQDEWDTEGESEAIDVSAYAITVERLALMKDSAVIMHPLPRRSEISPEVDSDPRAKYWRQVRNGMWIRAALIMNILDRAGEVDRYYDDLVS